MKIYTVFEYRGTPFNPTVIYCGGFDSREEAAIWIYQNNSIGSWYEIKEIVKDEED